MSNTEETPLLSSLEGRKRSRHESQVTGDYEGKGVVDRSSINRRRKWRKWGGSTAAGVMMFAVTGFVLTMIFYSVREANSNSQFSTSFSHVLTRGPLAWTARGTAREYTDQSDTQEALISLEKDYRNRDEKEEREEMREDRDMTPNEESHPGTRPNIFFIMIDDMGWNDIGFQSTDLWAVTPNMDNLAENGIKLSNYYSMSICTPARASLMTGRYPTRYGLQYEVIQPGAPWGLPLEEKLLPEYLNEAGYESHMVGKWHIGSYTHSHTPHQRGFKTFLGYLNDEETYWTHQSWTASYNDIDFFDFGFGNETGYFDVIDRNNNQGPSSTSTSTSSSDRLGKPAISFSSDRDPGIAPPRQESALGEDRSASGPIKNVYSAPVDNYLGMYSTKIFNDRAIEIIQSKTPYDEEPLFLYLAHQAVHEPLGEPSAEDFSSDEWATLDSIRPTSNVRTRFAKALFYLDKTIGLLMEQLEQHGWLENSIVVLTSDNGGCPTHGGSNYPLRGIKHTYWEGGTKVPAIVYSKSHLPKQLVGTTYDGLMHVTDWLPTLMAAAGEEVSGSAGPLDGMNHWEYITGVKGSDSEPSPRTEMLYNWDPYILWSEGDTIKEADYPLPQGAFRRGKYKLLRNVWCTGFFSFDPIVERKDHLCNDSNTCLEGGTCNSCGVGCISSANHSDWLIDLEADPREEHNLIWDMPELANEMRNRATEIAFSEWTNSLQKDIEPTSYIIWSKLGYWMAPWYHLFQDGFGDYTATDDGESWSSSS